MTLTKRNYGLVLPINYVSIEKDEPNSPIQCVSFEDNLTEKNNIDGEQIVHPDVFLK